MSNLNSTYKKVFSAEETLPKDQNKVKLEYERIQLIERNKKNYIELKLKNLYSSLDISSKGGELDPIIYIMEQSKAEIEQSNFFNEIKNIEKELLSKYELLKSKLKSNILSGETIGLTIDSIDRDIENLKEEFSVYKATIINKSEILPFVNDIVDLKANFEFSENKMKNSLRKEAYIGDIYKFGYSLANIFMQISDRFFNKAEIAAYESLSDVLNKNGLKFKSLAQAWMNKTDTTALPGLFDRFGRGATPAGEISSTMSLASTAANEMVKYAKNNSVESNNRFEDYWNSLMMQSIDPVELGTIIYEKPKHGDKTIKEEQKLHHTKFKKNMMKKSKPRFKKDK
jgi:hypothetical protein